MNYPDIMSPLLLKNILEELILLRATNSILLSKICQKLEIDVVEARTEITEFGNSLVAESREEVFRQNEEIMNKIDESILGK